MDGLSARLLKAAAPAISPSLTNIINQSLSTGVFPEKWKTARVAPLHKAGDKSDKGNYRPISILCVVSKIIERHVHESLYKYFTENGLLYIAQSGFRAFHSCETALIKLVDKWTENIENGLLNGIVFLDLRKAFDLVDTNILLQKLELYGCDENSMLWFKSYLQGRQQCVQYKGQFSAKQSVTHGVPQGSILGPLLFIVYMNDLPLFLNNPIDMFADDSTLHCSGKTIPELETKLNIDMENTRKWCTQNKMAVNETKTKTMLITTYQKETVMKANSINVTYQGANLENVESEKILGVQIDKHLTWENQVNNVCKKVSKGIALLRRIKAYLSHDLRVQYYKAFIQPHLDYCSVVWGHSHHVMPKSETLQPRLLKLQKMAMRIICDQPKLAHSNPLFKKCGVLKIADRVKLRTLTMVYKSLNGLAPPYMSEMFNPLVNVNKRVTRNSVKHHQLHVAKDKLEIRRKCVRHMGAMYYNDLPVEYREVNGVQDFKTKLYKDMLDRF